MVANLMKALLVLFVFLVVMKNSDSQFATAKSVHDVEVGTPSIRDLQEVEARCKKGGSPCTSSKSCCSRACFVGFCCWNASSIFKIKQWSEQIGKKGD